MKIEVHLVSAFTVNGTGGNPAGVVLHADHLSDSQKLTIAQAVGYSETAFVSRHEQADFEVSFFTTTEEVDFCGHATLATFSTLFNQQILTAGVYTQKTKAGFLPVHIKTNGNIVMQQTLPHTLGSIPCQVIANALGIEERLLASTGLPIEIVSTGLPDVIIGVPLGVLDSIVPNDALIAEICKQHQVVGFHVFELCEQGGPFTASCRNFAPLFGISEESATGSSSGALACYLTEHLGLGDEFVFEQGRAMGCQSVITASIESEGSVITQVEVGGVASHLQAVSIAI